MHVWSKQFPFWGGPKLVRHSQKMKFLNASKNLVLMQSWKTWTMNAKKSLRVSQLPLMRIWNGISISVSPEPTLKNLKSCHICTRVRIHIQRQTIGTSMTICQLWPFNTMKNQATLNTTMDISHLNRKWGVSDVNCHYRLLWSSPCWLGKMSLMSSSHNFVPRFPWVRTNGWQTVWGLLQGRHLLRTILLQLFHRGCNTVN